MKTISGRTLNFSEFETGREWSINITHGTTGITHAHTTRMAFA